jgi:alpha-tubulin suppressor-like RCC1 family protein
MNGRGQLGDGTTTERRTPVQVAGLHDAAEIAAGVFFVCARLRDGTARCWGTNESGQLGDGTTQARSAPTPVRGLADVAQLALGESHGCARLNDGTVRCWGANDACQLGHPETTPNSAEPAAGCCRAADAFSARSGR